MSSKTYKKILKASPYYLEEVLGFNLNERAENGQISFLLLNQAPVCDAHCRRCFMPDYRRQLGNKESLSLDEFKIVLDQARKYGAQCLEISGEGEPTLSRNLPFLISHANNLGYLTTLITNGHKITDEQIQQYKESNVTLIFSHYSLDGCKYEFDNGASGSFNKKMQHIEKAAEVFKDSISKEKNSLVYKLAIHATLQKDNIEDVLKLREYCDNKSIFFSVAPLAQTGCAVNYPEMELSEIVEINSKLVSLSKVSNLIGDNSIIHSHSSSLELEREVCGTCFYGLNIGYDGAVLFDAHAGYEIGNMLGNVKDAKFSKIIETQRKISRLLFDNIDGFCPVRDPKWEGFLEKVLSGDLKL